MGAVDLGFGPTETRIRKKVSGKTKAEVRDKLRELHKDLDAGLRPRRRCGEFGRLADLLIPFLVTRQLICGAGALLHTPRGPVYCLSRPTGLTGTGLSSAAARPRPFITTRDEPRAAGLRRLRVTVSDPAMSETTTLLKAGATDLVLRTAETGTAPSALTLASPVQAIGEVSGDITGRTLLRLADGRQVSALDIQREYLARAAGFTGDRGADADSVRVRGLARWSFHVPCVDLPCTCAGQRPDCRDQL